MSDGFDLDKIEWVKDARRVRLEPGDVVIVRTREELSEETAAYLKTRLQDIFPDNKVIVLDGDIEIGVVEA